MAVGRDVVTQKNVPFGEAIRVSLWPLNPNLHSGPCATLTYASFHEFLKDYKY